MINIRTIRKIENNGGLTLKKGKIVEYKTGYQVATYGIITTDINTVRDYIKMFDGNCGLWLEDGVWYIDRCQRVSTKRDALALGRECKQIFIFKWADKTLIYC